VRRTSMQLAAAVLAGGLAVAACGNSLTLGSAATTSQGRITTNTLTNQVANLDTAYKKIQHKGIKPQRPVTQMTQQVLTWLLTFKVYDKVADQHGIKVTSAQVQRQLAALAQQAAQQKVSTADYVSAAGAVPPDLLPQIGRYFAILTALEKSLDGGKSPSDQAGQQALQQQIAHQQCLAAKDLGIKVNPQYGAFDYATFQVVTVPSKLAAAAAPSASPTSSAKPRFTPPC
jgi:hypothetical protein